MTQGLEAYGAFFRVTHPDETDIGYIGSYVDEETVALETDTLIGDARWMTRMTPTESSSTIERRRSGHAVNVFLDGKLLRTAEWRGHAGDWVAILPINDAILEISTTSESPSTEITLVASRGLHD